MHRRRFAALGREADSAFDHALVGEDAAMAEAIDPMQADMRNDNAFSAGYVMGQEIGLVVYKVEKDGSLHGLWTIAGKDGSGTEVLTPK